MYELSVMECYTDHADAFFRKGEGSHNSHEMKLSDLPGMSLHTSSSLLTYTANIGIWLG